MELDMTSGKPLNTLLKFSLPLLAGSVIQNLYNIFDTAIVGHVLGKYALAAVGNSYVPTLIINSIVLGIASGISILVAQLYGSKDKGQICKCYGSVQTLIVAVGFGLAVLFFALAGWIFKAMQIPEEITSPAALYLRIVAAGIPFLAIYNFYSALIKAKGDSRTPIRCICLSCVLNILLDYLFVACFGWGIAGAASATVLSQALAAVLVGLHLYRQEHPVIRTAPSAGLIVPILQLSITGIVQNGASAISMFFIQGIINTFGVNEISAYTSAYKIESILTIPAVNLGVALSVYIGQNVGAGEYDRTRQGLKDSFKIAAVFTTLAMAILWFASPLLMVLVVGKEMAVIPIGVQYLRIISVTFPLCVSLYLLTNFLRGAGEIAYPLFNTLLELCFRTFSAFVLAHYFGFVGVLMCRPLSFVVSTISLSCRLLSGKWKDKINHSV